MVIQFLTLVFISISLFPRKIDSISSETSDYITFFGKNYSWHEWNAERDYLHNLLTHGSWVDAWEAEVDYAPLYNHFCFWSVNNYLLKYTSKQCLDSPGMQGTRYIWKSSLLGRTVAPWSLERMCKIMNGRNLLLIGDSLQEEIFYAAISAISRSILVPFDQQLNETYIQDKRSEVINRCDQLCSDYALTTCEGPVTVECGNYPSFQISNLRVLYLSPPGDTKNKKESVKLQDSDDWLDRIAKFNASLIFMNTGAHHVDTPKILQNLNISLNAIYEKYPDVSIIYRNTPPGHPECDKTFHSPPIVELSRNPDAYFNISQDHPDYKWKDFIPQSDQIEAFLTRHFPQVLHLNYITATLQRADSHSISHAGDCLHYCAQSVIDDWFLFLYYALVELEDSIPESSESHHKRKHFAKIEENDDDRDSNEHSKHFRQQHHHRPHQNSSSSQSTHILVPSFPNKFVSDPTLKAVSVLGKSYYLIENGTRHLIPDGWTLSIYLDDWKTPRITIDFWDFINIPAGLPLKPIPQT